MSLWCLRLLPEDPPPPPPDLWFLPEDLSLLRDRSRREDFEAFPPPLLLATGDRDRDDLAMAASATSATSVVAAASLLSSGLPF